MKIKNKIATPNKWIICYIMLFFVAVGLGRFHYNFIFAIKPVIVLTGAGIFITLFILKELAPLYSFEKWFIVFLFVYLLACIRPDGLNVGIRYICGILLVLLCYFCIRIALDKISLSQLELIISYSGIIICGLSFISYIWGLYLVDFHFSDIPRSRYGGILFENHIPRLFGTLDKDPNIAALMLLIYFIFYLYHLNKARNIAGIILSGSCLLLTLSRSAILTLAFAVLLGKIIPYYRREPIRFRRIYILIPIFIFLFLIILKMIGVDWWEMLKHRLSLLANDKGTGRFVLWKYGIQGWLNQPIFGIGGNQTKIFIQQFWGSEQVLHNTWLELLLETGVIGIIPCIVFSLKLLANTLKCGMRSGQRWLVVLLFATLIMMCSLSVWFNFNFYLVVAVLYRYIREENEKENAYAGTRNIY